MMETNSVVFFGEGSYPELPGKPIIAAWELNHPGNIGSLVRLAGNLGSNEVFMIGEPSRFRLSSIKKTAGLSYDHVKLHFMTPEEFFQNIAPEYSLVAVETAGNSENIFRTKLPEKIVFLLGSERYGIPPDVLNKCHQTVHIPMTGICKSMNVAQAAAVAVFEWQRQMLFSVS